MDVKTLRSKSVSALNKELDEARAHVLELRFKLSANQLKDVRDVRATKKRIAHILTILKEKEQEEAVK